MGRRHVLGWVGADPPVDVREPVEATHRGQALIDLRRRQSPLLEGTHVPICGRLAARTSSPTPMAHWKLQPFLRSSGGGV